MLHGIQNRTSDFNMSYISPYAKNELPKFVPIAPTPEKTHLSLNLDCSDMKKRYSYKNNPYSGAQAASIARRNARERNRVKQVNDGFNALRKKIPASVVSALSGGARRGSGKKLSKVDTLRIVVEYIKYLQSLIDESDAANGVPVQTTNVMNTSFEIDEGIFGGRNSPYSDSVPSPANSECSSGVSSNYSSGNEFSPNNQISGEIVSPMNDGYLLDAISWWQQK